MFTYQRGVEIDYFDDVFNLDDHLADYILPRLKYFKKQCHGYPGELTDEEYDEILDKIIHAFELMSDDDIGLETDEQKKEIDEGLALFGKWFRSLWL